MNIRSSREVVGLGDVDISEGRIGQLPLLIVFSGIIAFSLYVPFSSAHGIVVFDDNGYASGHGALITIIDNAATSPLTVTVNDTCGNGGTSNGVACTVGSLLNTISLTFTVNAGAFTLPDYLMLTNSPTNAGTDPPNLQTGIGDNIVVSYHVIVNGLSTTKISDTRPIVDPNELPLPNAPVATPFYTNVIIPCPNGGSAAGSSGDHICDAWKALPGLSIPYTDPNNNGNTVTYKYYCVPNGQANPNTSQPLGSFANPDPVCPSTGHKDVFVEVDWMKNHGPSLTAINDIVTAYKKAGIYLHIQLDEEILHHQAISGPNSGETTSDYSNIKNVYFGTLDERSTANCSSTPGGGQSAPCVKGLLTAKYQVFHYALFAHNQQPSNTCPNTPCDSSGKAEVVTQPDNNGKYYAANDILISLGSFSYAVGSPDQQEGTFMHELGHNLGLGHGGSYSLGTNQGPDVNCKPNYLSVMSWSRQFSNLFGSQGRPLDYSGEPYREVLWMKFQNDYTDSSGAGNNGALVSLGGPQSQFVPGKVGRAFQDFGNNYVNVLGNPTNLNFDNKTAFTVSFWANVPIASGGTSQAFVTKMTGNWIPSGKGWAVWMFGGNNRIYFDLNDGTTVSELSSTDSINDGLWHHYTIVYSGANGKQMSIYIDGTLNGQPGTSSTANTISNNANTVIGGNSAGAYLLNGMIDEVQIYNVALSGSQVSSLFNNAQPLYRSAPSGSAVLWYELEGPGPPITDSSGAGNDGALSGIGATFPLGIVNNVLQEAGSGYIDAKSPNNLNFDGTTPFTVSFWANVPIASGGTSQAFVTKMTGNWIPSGKGWAVWMFGGNNRIYFDLNDVINPVSELSSTDSINDGLWHHYTIVYSVANGKQMSIYIDDTLNNQATVSNLSAISNSAHVVIAGNSAGNNYFLNGRMDEVQIYNVALSGPQISVIYRQPAVGYDTMLNENSITENPVTSIPNQYTVYGHDDASTFSAPVSADMPTDWDEDKAGESTPDAAKSNLLHAFKFASATPNAVPETCSSDGKQTLYSNNDWNNLFFDMTGTAYFGG